jgi:uncharacterized phage protein (TIGR01671 family)|nr:MAG TPA: YopX protein [Caudoviricetes sp.]
MREILFKAKRLDNGEWFEGVPVDVTPLVCFASDKAEQEVVMVRAGFADWGMPRGMEYTKVDPSTVSQYTGLTDKNGKKVFVGDIVRCSRGCPHEVVWVQEHGGTFIGGMPAVYLSGLTPGYAWTGAEEVIGSIHDGEGERYE